MFCCRSFVLVPLLCCSSNLKVAVLQCTRTIQQTFSTGSDSPFGVSILPFTYLLLTTVLMEFPSESVLASSLYFFLHLLLRITYNPLWKGSMDFYGPDVCHFSHLLMMSKYWPWPVAWPSHFFIKQCTCDARQYRILLILL